MPAVVVDSVVVTGGWDPSALERGLQASNQRLQQFVQQAANTRIGIQIEIGGGGGQAALEQIAASIGRLEATLTAAAAPANSFFGDMVQGAQEALAEFAPLESRTATLARLLADLPSPQIDTLPAVSAINTLIERQQLAIRTAATLQGVLNQPIKAPPSLPTGVTLLGSQDVTRVRQIRWREGESCSTRGRALLHSGRVQQGVEQRASVPADCGRDVGWGDPHPRLSARGERGGSRKASCDRFPEAIWLLSPATFQVATPSCRSSSFHASYLRAA